MIDITNLFSRIADLLNIYLIVSKIKWKLFDE